MSDRVRPFVTVVSGVPRSGTSLMMRLLAAGGIPALSDGVRRPDADNPFGYYELEAVKRLPEHSAWLGRAEGRAVKVIHALLDKLPSGPGAPGFRVVLMRRRLEDAVASQGAMLARRGAEPPGTLAPERLAEVFRVQLEACVARLRRTPGFSLLEVEFEALLADPSGVCAELDRFLGGGLDRGAMEAVVAPRPHRLAGYTPRTLNAVEIGPIRFVVEHRAPGPEGGPTLRVRRAADDRELLRFDCFARGAHWHLDPAGRDEITRLPPALDALEWTLAEVRRDLPGYLARTGLIPVPPLEREALELGLERVEEALRNSPPQLDALDVAALRERRGEKWSVHPEDVLPLWVADMDFPVAEPIRRRLQRCLDLGDLGYPMHPRPTGIPALFARRMQERFGWRVEARRVEIITDVVQGIYAAIEGFTKPGDGVVIQTPIYPPFLHAVHETDRALVENPLREGQGGFEVDLDGLRRQVRERARLLLLCNPHNPSGRVLRRDELEGIAEIALERELLIVSDEIHADLVYPGARHIPIASLSPEVEASTITLNSASKPFNIAGLRCAVAAFGSPELRKHFLACPRHLRGGLGSLGIEATLEAWTHADPWLRRVLAYLEANRDYVADFVERELPGVGHHPPQATYLAWLDCRALDLAPSPGAFFQSEARVALSDGAGFGAPGVGFVRLNFATSREILSEALERMAEALRARGG